MDEKKSPKKNTKTLFAIVGVLVLCCCVLAAAAAVYFFVLDDNSSNLSGEAKNVDNYKTYEGEKFTFKYPEDWTLDDSFGVRVYDPEKPDSNGVEFVVYSSADSQADINIEEILNGNCASVEALSDQLGSENVSVKGVENVEINGNKGCAIVAEVSQGDLKATSAFYFFGMDDTVLNITALEEGSKLDVASNIVKTFNFVK